jgi:hypothetical protein
LTWCFAASSVCNFLSLVFFASDVCAEGCEFGTGTWSAIVAGCLWLPAAATSYMIRSAKLSEDGVPPVASPGAVKGEKIVETTSTKPRTLKSNVAEEGKEEEAANEA